jgi:hypothetical protein
MKTLKNIIKGVISHVKNKLKLLQSVQLFGLTELYNRDIESDNHNKVINILDNMAKPVRNNSVVNANNVYSNNRDPNIANAY